MSVATTTAIAIGAGVSAAGALGGAAIASHGANKAASTQAAAAEQAAQLQYQAGQNSLAETQREFNIGQQNLAPWLQQGRGALANLSYLLGLPLNSATSGTSSFGGATLPDGTTSVPGRPGNPPRLLGARGREFGADMVELGRFSSGIMPEDQGLDMAGGGDSGNAPIADMPSNPNDLSQYVNKSLGAPGSLLAPYPGGQFVAPDAVTEKNDPGYQFRMQQAQQALEHSAAAKGNILSGGTAQQEGQLAEDYASNEYNNVYNRALTTYGTNFNTYQQNQANTFNRLAAMSGVGQTTAGQLSTLGQNNANTTASILMNTAGNIGQDIQNAGVARASGYVGSANAFNSALTGGTGGLANLYLLSQLLNHGGLGSSYGATIAGGMPPGA